MVRKYLIFHPTEQQRRFGLWDIDYETQSQYKSSNTEDVGAKSVSDRSHLISRNNKRKKYFVQKGQ